MLRWKLRALPAQTRCQAASSAAPSTGGSRAASGGAAFSGSQYALGCSRPSEKRDGQLSLTSPPAAASAPPIFALRQGGGPLRRGRLRVKLANAMPPPPPTGGAAPPTVGSRPVHIPRPHTSVSRTFHTSSRRPPLRRASNGPVAVEQVLNREPEINTVACGRRLDRANLIALIKRPPRVERRGAQPAAGGTRGVRRRVELLAAAARVRRAQISIDDLLQHPRGAAVAQSAARVDDAVLEAAARLSAPNISGKRPHSARECRWRSTSSSNTASVSATSTLYPRRTRRASSDQRTSQRPGPVARPLRFGLRRWRSHHASCTHGVRSTFRRSAGGSWRAASPSAEHSAAS